MKNEIPELIPDEQFVLLAEKQFLHMVNLRNFIIRGDFTKMKKEMGSDKALRQLKKRFPKLKYSTLLEYTR